ncbi:hypothetical protein GCM10023194_80970 [Planotetraspora phitsanulokensis]|uniref:Uncharacterized protein n=1 Tax=Planotetraspora phitsanulokensis TaxID=575192 RepID=A0A8J3XIX5_9ACTN|nr:hypothetical protein [Planotetraspora phitsanulokensis]GII42829.1 hypothetical protein Pph01_78320 [Planotetraspora phitsanulokensis]
MNDRPLLTKAQRGEVEGILLDILGRYPISPDAVSHVMANFDAELENWAGPDWFTLLYTGWRGADRDRVREDLLMVRNMVGPMRLIVGFDPKKRTPAGGDMHAYDWGMEAPGVIVETRPAPWHLEVLRRGSAGPYRNGLMLGLALARGLDNVGVLAHLHPESRGAAGTAAYAEDLGLKVWKRPAI